MSLKEVVFCHCLKGENQRFLAFSWKSLLVYFKTITKFWDTADYRSTVCSFQLRTSPEKNSLLTICGAILAYSATVYCDATWEIKHLDSFSTSWRNFLLYKMMLGVEGGALKGLTYLHNLKLDCIRKWILLSHKDLFLHFTRKVDLLSFSDW